MLADACVERVAPPGVFALQQIQWEGREALSTLRPSSTTSDVACDLISDASHEQPPLPATDIARPAVRVLGLTIAVAVTLTIAGHARAHGDESLQFSEGFLIGGRAIDMQRYAQGNPMKPGVY